MRKLRSSRRIRRVCAHRGPSQVRSWDSSCASSRSRAGLNGEMVSQNKIIKET